MPKVTIKFFQDIRELAGTSSTEIEIDSPKFLKDILNEISNKYQKLRDVFKNIEGENRSVIILVNGRMPTPLSSTIIKGGEEISILPVVEGG
jgi:MoaD family protein